MLKHYLKITLRNLWKEKGYTFINLTGLTVGLACFLFITLFVLDELSYDKHFKNAESIFRVAVKGVIGDQELNGAQTSSLLAKTLLQEYPEVLQGTRLHHTPNMLVRFGEKVFNETRFMWVDSNFFDVFSIPLIHGDPETALKDDHTVVMTLETAKKFFDNPAEAIGKIVTFEDGTPYQVSGIAENAPENSHFHYGMLSPLSSWEWNWDEWWLNNYMWTYILLHRNASPAELETKLPQFIRKYVAPHLERASGMSMDEFQKSGGSLEFYLQPLTDIHLHSHLDGELEPNSDIKYVYIFSVIALFILSIACINFMNLSTSRATSRSKEVGVRKVLGSTQNKLILQFLIESILLSFVAVFIAILLVKLFIPYFNDITDKNLYTGYFDKWYIIPGLLVLTIIVGVLSGSYPAFVLSSFKPVAVLKGILSTGMKGRTLRGLLVIFQFTISIVLFVSTLMVQNQLRFIQNKRLGFEKENIVVIKRGWAVGQNPDGSLIDTPPGKTVIDAFKNDLLQNPQILSVSGSSSLPGKSFFNGVFVPEGAPREEQHPLNYFMADYDFVETYKLELLEGRFYERERASDSNAVVINEAVARTFGYERPYVGKRIGFPGNDEFYINIIGVIKDFHYESLHKPIRPLMIGLNNLDRTFIGVRIRPENVPETLEYIEKTWLAYIPYKPFEFFFFDEDYDNLYRAEQRTGKLFSIFSVLAIFIACLGLFGLASFTTERRTKEIGIRKTLGASVPNIVLLLSKEFIRWVLVATIIAWPIAWYFMNSWLQNFAYRIGITVWPFLLAAITALLIAVVTVIFQSVKTALTNPVESLRYE